MKRWRDIRSRIAALDEEKRKLANELAVLQEECEHPNLPEREIGTEYCDTCPDCGYWAFCCAM